MSVYLVSLVSHVQATLPFAMVDITNPGGQLRASTLTFVLPVIGHDVPVRSSKEAFPGFA